jgi:putative acetyltransferase
MSIDVRRDDLSGAEVQALVREHLAGMMSNSPPQSVHALPLDVLRNSDITFWSVWLGAELAGCGALKELDPKQGEIKCMRTKLSFLRQGVGQAVLSQILQEAGARGYQRLSLETGSTEPFRAAQALYSRNGFELCGPFGGYKFDPFSVYMTRTF